MTPTPPRATSVTREGADDGFVVLPGWHSEATPDGETRLVAQVPADGLLAALEALIDALSTPLSVLYRQKIDRRAPKPEGAPPVDRVGLSLNRERVRAALRAAPTLVASDARAEIWIRGQRGEQVVLDQDGLLYCYPDDPTFRDALARADVPAVDVVTLAQRDYVKHWFRVEADAEEDAFADALRLTAVPHRK